MNQDLINSVENMFKKYPELNYGIKQDINEVNEVNKKLSNMIPQWFIELITQYPVCGLEVGMPDYKDIILAKINGIYSNTAELSPGYLIKDKGYLCISSDATGMGDPLFVSVNEGDNPPVYCIYHDANTDNPDKHLVANKLSDFFDMATMV